jgi:class 3 adenylate cyclase
MTMTTAIVKRRLAAILCADVAGYTRLMNADEVATLRLLAAHREITDRLIAQHDGRIANTAGDSILAEFPSALDAAQCALAIQERHAVVNAEMPEERRLSFRIGIHVGEAMVRDGDLFGDSVNVASRMQSLAEPGCICLSGPAHDYVHRSLPGVFEDLGPQQVKNLDKPVQCYRLRPSDTLPLRAIPPVHRRNEANLMRRCYEMMRKEIVGVTEAEGLEPRRLRKRGQTGESRFYFHKSRYIEINDGGMTFP